MRCPLLSVFLVMHRWNCKARASVDCLVENERNDPPQCGRLKMKMGWIQRAVGWSGPTCAPKVHWFFIGALCRAPKKLKRNDEFFG
ncbi:hypothetical protein MED297_11950 [Reinekea sp. MED297]|uniref:Uncharacterized protein n=1 Tax=Reinekea blandensis MED297 TaxID=314283 RepID=A4BBB5_9GAMM|nr:hypothetical protein MED297_11950 [Reinekea sp. MED297] [Reinekea blandensis MED297]